MTSRQRDVPANWEWVTLETIADINPKLPFELEDEVDVSFIPMKRVEKETGQVDLTESRKYGDIKKGYSKFINNDIIFAKITPCMENGKIAILKGLENGVGIGSTEFHVIRMKNKSLSRQLYFYFLLQKRFRKLAAHNFTGTVGHRRVPTNFMKEVLVPLPPFYEQVRIVVRVEELFSRLDAGVRSLQAAQTQLEQYRQTTLKQAYTGQLTQKWKQKRPIQEEASSKQEDVNDTFVLPEELSKLPDGWKWVFIGNIGKVSGGLTKNSKRNKIELKLPYVRVANVYANELRLDDVKEIGIKESELNRVLLKKGDLLIVEGNGSLNQIGRMAIWDGSIDPCVHQNHIIKVRFNDEILANFVSHWFLSSEARKYIVEVASSTSGLYTLSLSKVSGLPVPLPSKKEQEKILEIISTNFSIVNKITTEIKDSRLRVESLKNSILKKAFEGRLVPQNPRDAPASVLLNRIKDQNAKQRKLI